MIGHGIGLECSEPPIISKYNQAEIPENSVMCIEIHMYKNDIGAVKLEDMTLITSSGNSILTKSPRDLIEIL